MKAEYGNRLDKLRQLLAQHALDALAVIVQENRLYLSGFCATNALPDEVAGILLITANHQALVTNNLYLDQAKQESTGWQIKLADDGLEKTLADLAAQWKLKKVGFESHGFTYHRYRRLAGALETCPGNIRLVDCRNLVETLRLTKSQSEIDASCRALEIAEKAFPVFLEKLKPGMTEIEAAWELEKAIREEGADEVAFEPMVISGANSALPHGRPGSKVILSGEPVLCDWGANSYGYCSDISRTVVLGQPDDKFIEVFETVRRAQEIAASSISPGIKAVSVDKAARDFIDAGAFKGRFTHGLGHGTGLAVHEDPHLNSRTNTCLKPGMIVTIEPGIYLPGWGGVRLENQVLVTDEGGQVLNSLERSWNPDDYFR